MKLKLISTSALLCATLQGGNLHAAPADALAECVELAPDYQATRFGSQYLLVKNGETHYRLSFGGGSCDAIAMSSRLKITTEGTANRLCPTGTRVATKNDRCSVRSVEEIRADEYERYRQRARR